MLSSTGTLRWAASANAAGPQAFQSTGLSRCWRRYGEVSSPSRFTWPNLPAGLDGEDAEAGGRGLALGVVALLGEPALQRVGAEVLGDDEHGGAVGCQPAEPADEQGVECRLADADRRVAPDRGEAQVVGHLV